MSLTKRQQLFVNSYCENPDLGQTAAAKAAGVGRRAQITACEWMRRPEIITEIQRRMQGGIETAIRKASDKVTTQSVLKDMAELEELIKQQGMGAWQSAALLKIIELRGKYLKMFTEKVELDFSDKLMARLEGGRKRAGIAPELPAETEVAAATAESSGGETSLQ